MSPTPTEEFTLALSPHGLLYLFPSENGRIPERIQVAFATGAGDGLKHLGLWEFGATLSPDLVYWRKFSQLYFSHLCALPGLAEAGGQEPISLPPPLEDLIEVSKTAPPMVGGEYLNSSSLAGLWKELDQSFQEEVRKTGGSVQEFLSSRRTVWNLVGRVCFHLVENKESEDTPFAFLATYTHKLSARGKAQHLPLGNALKEYGGGKNKSQLLQLLLPIQKGAEKSKFLKSLIDSSEIFDPLAWSPTDAYQFLQDIPLFESAGILVRVPDWWKAKKPPRPQVSVTVGGKKTSLLGIDSMLKFSVKLTLEGEEFSEAELKDILSMASGLALIRGRWVEIDQNKLREVLDHWKSVERSAVDGEISFIQGMRLLSGATKLGNISDSTSDVTKDWTQITAGEGLLKILEKLKNPEEKLYEKLNLESELQATLRPYQKIGVNWLWFLNQLGLGACLADDMGLGKTIQVISLFLLLKRNSKNHERKMPSLLVVPASLLGNWKSEMERFAPSLRPLIAHPSAGFGAEPGAPKSAAAPEILTSVDVVITTYGFLDRLSWLRDTSWNCIVIDEAQAIKNSGSKQTRAVKSLKGKHRIALTGTPIENRLSDLWSLYDFLCPGLLGSGQDFTKFVKSGDKTEPDLKYAALRNLVRPYLLRRLKTDKSIIADLPDKTEVSAYCSLSRTQAALYQQSVVELTQRLEHLDGIQRRGVVLSFLMRFKQICNHPSQWLSDGHYFPQDSGKFGRLRELCEDISAKQEKVLVFTQFREMTEPLAGFLKGIFGRPGLVLHGGTAVKKRKELVDAFQDERGAPFFILSLKAGGTGLNLTAASHVIHFDRWWNPAVENQATDRAYRIGQKKNVLVHKFICQGTVEEKIDELMSSKQNMSQDVLEGSSEAILTELGNDELLKLVSLDIRSVVEEV